MDYWVDSWSPESRVIPADVRILTAVTVHLAGRRVRLSTPKHRLVLAMLVAAEGRLVPTGQLIDQIWEDQPPQSARERIHEFMADLRRSLNDELPGASDMLPRHRDGGYRFNADRENVDLYRFRDLCARARSITMTDDAQAATLLREALSLWGTGLDQGDGPLNDLTTAAVADCQWLKDYRQTLREERRSALITCLETELRLGQHERLIIELAGLAATAPLDERIAGLLMIAYYRSGRQSDATALYRRTRERLRAELGVEPGQRLRELYQEVLRQDPGLDLPAAPAATAAARPRSEARRPAEMPDPNYLVGRASEIAAFDELFRENSERPLFNIYGPSGIGKSVVCARLLEHARNRGLLAGAADISLYGSTPVSLLRELARSLLARDRGDSNALFDEFTTNLDEFDTVSELVKVCGGTSQMFDVVGHPKDPDFLEAQLSDVGAHFSVALHATVRNRFALERYLRSAADRLASSFADALAESRDNGSRAVIMLDTYEEVRTVDTWVRNTLLPGLAQSTLLVILGRNHLPDQNLDWKTHTDHIQPRQLRELSEDESKAYLRHYGLTDPEALTEIYRFTGGYPLLLVLVRQLAHDAGGWAAVGHLDQSGDRDRIASQMLERILREERVHEIRDVLEKCAIASWINPEVITALLGFEPALARDIFEKVRRHSFMDRHPEGVRLHEKIRELLIGRLRFTSQDEFDRLTERLLAYHSSRTSHD